MNDQTHILAAILALTDAVFLPCRSWTKPLPQNVYQARRTYQNGGVPWRPKASSDAQRKSTERELAVLADAGTIHICRRQGLRFPLVKLSDETDWRIRGECGLPAQEGAHLIAMELKRLADAIGDPTTWVSEFSLMKNATDKIEAMIVEGMALPLLTRGYAISNSNILGSVFYRLTDAGLQWLENMKAPKPDSAKADTAAAKVYDESIVSALHTLETEKITDSRELGAIPLPVGAHENCSQPAKGRMRNKRP